VMIEAGDIDEALEIAGGIPLAEIGTIEVRAIYSVPGS
ncbi:MAG: YciI family protein, partial [Mesorhizobium sp.]